MDARRFRQARSRTQIARKPMAEMCGACRCGRGCSKRWGPSEKPVRSVRNKLTRDGAGLYKRPESSGGMAERLKAPVLKTGRRVTVSWVRIPLPPPTLPAFSQIALSAASHHSVRSGCRFLCICLFQKLHKLEHRLAILRATMRAVAGKSDRLSKSGFAKPGKSAEM